MNSRSLSRVVTVATLVLLLLVVVGGSTAASPAEPALQPVGECVSYSSADTPLKVPPTGSEGTTTSHLTVPDAFQIQDVNVTLNLPHAAVGDLEISLDSPGGTSVMLSDQNGGSGDNFSGTVFDDEAATAISAGSPPFVGRYRPDQPLSAFDLETAQGTWTLEVVDVLPGDLGDLNNWELEICGATAAQEEADLEVQKELLSEAIPGGDPVHFTVTVINNGPGTAQNVALHDWLEDLDYIIDDILIPGGGTPLWSCESGLTCTRHDPMPPGGRPETLEFWLRLPADAHLTVPDPPAQNCVNVTALNPDPNLANNDLICVPVRLTPRSDLRIGKRALTPEVAPGGVALFEVEVRNNGPSTLGAHSLSDTITAGPGQIVSAGVSCPGPFPTNSTNCEIRDLEPGARQQFIIAVKADDNATVGATIENTAEVEDVPPSPNSVVATVTVGGQLPAADVRVDDVRFTSAPFVPGAPATFEIDVYNAGGAEAQGVVLALEMADAILGLDSRVTPDAWLPGAGGGLFVRTSPMPVGQTETLRVTYQTASDAHIGALPDPVGGFAAAIAATNPDPNPDNNRRGTGFDTEPQIELDIEKTLLNDGVSPGGVALFEVVVSNQGPSDVEGLSITDEVTGGDPGTVEAISSDADNLYIPAGQTRDLLVAVRVANSATPGNTVENCAEVDPIPEPPKALPYLVTGFTGPACATLTVGQQLPVADVEVVEVRFPTEPFVPGTSETFQIDVRNNGDAQAHGVVLSLEVADAILGLDTRTTPPEWLPGAGGGMFVRTEPMPVGTIETLEVTYQTQSDAHVTAANGVGGIRATIVAANPDDVPGNNDQGLGFSTEPQVALDISKTLLNNQVAPGGVALFEIVVTNDGPSDVEGLSVSDAVTGGDPGAVDAFSSDAGDLYIPAGQTRDLVVAVRVDGSASPGDTVENCASIEPLPDPAHADPYVVSGSTGPACATLTVGNELVEADLSVTKTVVSGVPGVPGGDPMVFQLEVYNGGPSIAYDVGIYDLFFNLPVYLDRSCGNVTSVDPGSPDQNPDGWRGDSGGGCRRLEPMPPGQRETVEIAFFIPPDAHLVNPNLGTDPPKNRAYVFADNPDSILGDNNSLVSPIALEPTVDLDIVKTLLTPDVAPGGMVLFEVVVTNNGPSDADGLAVSDALTGPGTIVAESSDLSDLRVPAGQTRDILVSVQVDDSAGPGETIENCATLNTSALTDYAVSGNLGPVCDSMTVGTHLPPVDIDVTSTIVDLTAPIIAGQEYQFEMSVANNSDNAAQGVIVHDLLTDLPGDWYVTDLAPEPNWYCDGGLNCSRQDPMPGNTKETVAAITILVPPDTPAGGYGHFLSATADNPDTNLANNSKAFRYSVETAARVTISKQDLWDPVIVGGLGEDTVIYLLVVQNTGPSTAANVQVTDSFPAGMALSDVAIVDASYAGAPTACGTVGDNPLVCDLGEMPAGETAELYVVTSVDANVTGCELNVVNSAEVTWDDSSGANSTAVRAQTYLSCQGDLDLKKVGPPTVTPDDTLVYSLRVANTGPSPVLTGELTLEDQIPPGLSLVGYNNTAGPCNFDGGPPTWTNQATLPPGGTCELEIELQVTDEVCRSGLIFNEAQVHGLGSMDQAVWVTTAECNTELRVRKAVASVGLQAPVAGEGIYYDITVQNRGTVPAFDVELTDNILQPFDSGAASTGARIIDVAPLDSASPKGVCTDSGFCNLGDLAPGESVGVRVLIEIDPDQRGQTLRNQACVEARNAPRRCDRTDDPIESDAQLTLAKNDLTDQAVVGSLGGDNTVTYIISLQNNGPSDADRVSVNESLPERAFAEEWIINASYAGAPDTCSGDSCFLGRVPAGETVELYIVVRVPSADYCDRTVTNNVEVVWADDDALGYGPNNATASEDTELICQGDLDLKKTGPRQWVEGDPFTYVLTVTNTGPSPIPAGELTLQDEAPVGLSFVSATEIGPDTCGFTGTGPVWTNSNALPAGGMCVLEITAQVDAESACTTGMIFNEAQAHDQDNNLAQAVWLTPVDCTTELRVRKTALDPFVAGTVVDFEIIVENRGNVTAYDVEVTDNVALPRRGQAPMSAQIVDFDSPDLPLGACNDSGFCNAGNLAPGESITVNASVLIGSAWGPPEAESLRQQACAEADNAVMVCRRIADNVVREVDLHIEKTDLVDEIVAGGDPLLYTITIWNDGPSDAYDVQVSDTPAPDFSLVGSVQPVGPNATCTGGLCTIPVLEAGEWREFRAMIEAAPDATPGADREANEACFDHLSPDQSGCTIEDTDVIVAADVAIDKTGPITVTAGGIFTYTITIYNNGPADAEGIQIIDTLPYGLSWTGNYTAPNSVTCEAGATAGTVVCERTGASVAPSSWSGQIELQVQADSDICYEGKVNNYVEISSQTSDPDPSNNDDEWGTVILSPVDLSIEKEVVGSAMAGEAADFVLTIANNGPGCASDVTVMDALGFLPPPDLGNPAGTVQIDFDATQSTQGGPSPYPGGFWYNCVSGICERGAPMLAGVTDTVTLTVQFSSAAEEGAYRNWASVDSAATELDEGNNSVGARYDLETEADLSVDKVDLADPVSAKEGFAYELTVTNQGPSDAQNVLMTDTLDSNVTFASASPGCSGSAESSIVTCTLDVLPAGNTVDFLLAVVAGDVPSGTLLINDIEVTSDTHDPEPGNNSDSETTTVSQEFGPSADLGLAKSVTPSLVAAEDYVTYTLVITNAGPSAATDVELLELIPAGTVVISADADNPDFDPEFCTLNGICFLGTIHPHTVATVTMVLQVDADFEGTSLTNIAHVSGEQVDYVAANNIADATITANIEPVADLALINLATPTAFAGHNVTYTLTIYNAGPFEAPNIVISDTLPEGVTFASASPGCTYMGDRSVICNETSLAVGAHTSFMIVVKVAHGIEPGTSLQNLAVVASDATETYPSNNVDTSDTSILGFSNLYYLPLIWYDPRPAPEPLPDLVGSFSLTPDRTVFSDDESVLVTVIVRNVGVEPAGPFWVDFYVNPDPEPTHANVLWLDTCNDPPPACHGIAWQVTEGLDPGEQIVLTSTPDSYDPARTYWEGMLPAGTTDLYVYVDSWYPVGHLGAVVESNEGNNMSEMHGLHVVDVFAGTSAQTIVAPATTPKEEE